MTAEVGHGADAVEGDVFDPLLHFLYGAAADVAADVGLGFELFAKVEKFVGAKVVVFGDAAPVGVDHGGAVLFWADAFHPVIFVCKAATGPAQVGDFYGFECVDDVGADATYVGDVGIFADVDTVVNTATEVFGKVTVDVPVDGAAFDIGVEDEGVGHGFAFC